VERPANARQVKPGRVGYGTFEAELGRARRDKAGEARRNLVRCESARHVRARQAGQG